MKKGFTLIELLIVMVVVAVLVAIAAPKYYASMERGRALGGITHLKAASDFINARYVMNGNVYKQVEIGDAPENYRFDSIKDKNFENLITKEFAVWDSSVTFSIKRTNGDYTLTAHNEEGELQYIQCTPKASTDNICLQIGFDEADGTYKIKFSQQ